MDRQKKQYTSLMRGEQYTWIIRQEFNWTGGFGYTISLPEVEGCMSYGDTITEAKDGVPEALSLWLKQSVTKQLPNSKNKGQLIKLEPAMTVDDFNEINTLIQQYK